LLGMSVRSNIDADSVEYSHMHLSQEGQVGGGWIIQAPVLQHRGEGEDVGETPKAVVNYRLEHGRAPAGPPEPSWMRAPSIGVEGTPNLSRAPLTS
jgi:hypothetical protein